MASSRRRTSYSSSTPSDEVIDELSNISEKEVEVDREVQDTEDTVEVILPEITPTEAPAPYVEKVIVELLVENNPLAKNRPKETKALKRHPRNIPKFSPKKG
jgi:hypothetical protein